MPSRRYINPRAGEARRTDGIYVDMPQHPASAQRAVRPPAEAGYAADCAERVAAVLHKLGYGFAMIPRRKPSVPGH